MDRAADNLAVLGENGLHVGLGDQQGVEVAYEDPGVERAGVGLVGHVAAGHQAGGGGRRPTEGSRRREVKVEGRCLRSETVSMTLETFHGGRRL